MIYFFLKRKGFLLLESSIFILLSFIMIYTIHVIIQQTFTQYVDQKNYTDAQILIHEYIQKIKNEKNKIIQEKKINNFFLSYKHNDINISPINNIFEKKLQLSKLTVSWKSSKNHQEEISVWI